MKTLIFLLVTTAVCIGKALGERDWDVFALNKVIENLKGTLAGDYNLKEDFTCEGLTFFECYKATNELYEKSIKMKIVDDIDRQVLRHLEEYNVLVLSLLEACTGIADRRSSLERIIKAIHFEDSAVYCAIGFLGEFNRSVNDKLADYVFFADFDVLNKNDFDRLNGLVNDHFGTRRDSLREKLVTTRTKHEFVEDLLPAKKRRINQLFKPFCEVNAPWIKADLWTWKKVKNSQILSQNSKNRRNLLDWIHEKYESEINDTADIKKYTYSFDSSKSCLAQGRSLGEQCAELVLSYHDNRPYAEFRDSPSTGMSVTHTDNGVRQKLHDILQKMRSSMTESTTASELHVGHGDSRTEDTSLMAPLETTTTQIKYTDVEFSEVDRFHLKMSAAIDTYVTKVIFSKILKIITTALLTYHSIIKRFPTKNTASNGNIEKCFFEYFYLGQQIIVFKTLLELYNTSGPLTLDQNTVRDMDDLLDFSITTYMYHIVKMDDPRDSVVKIASHLNDKRFQSYYNVKRALQTQQTINWQELIDEIKQINMCIMELVVIKSQK